MSTNPFASNEQELAEKSRAISEDVLEQVTGGAGIRDVMKVYEDRMLPPSPCCGQQA